MCRKRNYRNESKTNTSIEIHLILCLKPQKNDFKVTFFRRFEFSFFLVLHLDQVSSDEPLTDDNNQENGSKPSLHYHSFPTHVYKESLPSTIYRTGEARTVRVSFFFSKIHLKITHLFLANKCP